MKDEVVTVKANILQVHNNADIIKPFGRRAPGFLKSLLCRCVCVYVCVCVRPPAIKNYSREMKPE